MKSQAYRMALLYDFYGDVLTDRQKEFYDLYYNEDLSLGEIAENNGITRQGVRDLIKRGEQTLVSLEEKCRYCERFLKLKELSAKARGGDKTAAERIFDIIPSVCQKVTPFSGFRRLTGTCIPASYSRRENWCLTA